MRTTRLRTAPAVVVLLGLSLVPEASAGPARISFERIRPAAVDLAPARHLAVVHAAGDTDAVDVFVEVLVDQVNQAGVLEARDAREGPVPADALLAIRTFSCETSSREGEGSTRDHDGNRTRRREVWVDAVCTARVDVTGRHMKRPSTFFGRGEGSSSHVAELTGEDHRTAVRQAARYAAIDAAERITPRRVRDHIPLDDSAPRFAEGLSLIESGRLREARAEWERALREHPRNAPLHANLAAVCEALGDAQAARLHSRTARALAKK